MTLYIDYDDGYYLYNRDGSAPALAVLQLLGAAVFVSLGLPCAHRMQRKHSSSDRGGNVHV